MTKNQAKVGHETTFIILRNYHHHVEGWTNINIGASREVTSQTRTPV